jgi:hypothetical protein
MLMIVRMKPRDAVHEMALGFGQRLLFFGASEATDRLLHRVPITA